MSPCELRTVGNDVGIVIAIDIVIIINISASNIITTITNITLMRINNVRFNAYVWLHILAIQVCNA